MYLIPKLISLFAYFATTLNNNMYDVNLIKWSTTAVNINFCMCNSNIFWWMRQISNCPQDGNIWEAEEATDGYILCLRAGNDSLWRQNYNFLQCLFLLNVLTLKHPCRFSWWGETVLTEKQQLCKVKAKWLKIYNRRIITARWINHPCHITSAGIKAQLVHSCSSAANSWGQCLVGDCWNY